MNNPFTRKSILEKAICVLAVIEDAHQRIAVCNWHIKTKNVFTTQSEMQKQIEIHQNAISRLENYYNNLISKAI